MYKFAKSFAVTTLLGLAAFGATSAANAVIVTDIDNKLESFGFAVDNDNRIIYLFETWGANTGNVVDLLFEDWDYGRGSWLINKTVTNNTGATWTHFSHELLQSDRGWSPDDDGLSFAQLGTPTHPRVSDVFGTHIVDELRTRDYLDFSDGSVAQGASVNFTYGLTARRENEGDTNPFYLRQITPAAVGGVPEPATWAMLVLGFGLVGVTVRRRNAHGVLKTVQD